MTEAAFRFCDDLGPRRILHICEPSIGLTAILVVDNVATGPSIGGRQRAAATQLRDGYWSNR